MSFKKKLTRIFSVMFIAATITGVILLTSFNSVKQKNIRCPEIIVNIDRSTELFFLDDTDIKEILINKLGDSVKGDNISSIHLAKIEEVLEANPFVQSAESFLDMQGNMHVHVRQKQPVARVINKFGVHYYLTESAVKFPLNDKFTCRVPVISGNIEEGFNNSDTIQSKVLRDGFKIIQFIQTNELWNAQTEQLYVNEDDEFDLIPMVGDQVIVFGKAENIKEKFEKLELFYTEGLNYTGWETYSKINLSFDNQIVCTKKDTL
ncbi:MAG: cell division protein FtsQ [Fimbriimonadaceae bacterium]|nr:cell division protein FtsQ [Chitinophagales bacterium]